jgi:hypothetical protein
VSQDKIINFTPDSGWEAWFVELSDKQGEHPWSLPVIGWAVVETSFDDGSIETEIEPVVLVDRKHPMPLSDYRQDLGTFDPPKRVSMFELSSRVQSVTLAQADPTNQGG